MPDMTLPKNTHRALAGGPLMTVSLSWVGSTEIPMDHSQEWVAIFFAFAPVAKTVCPLQTG